MDKNGTPLNCDWKWLKAVESGWNWLKVFGNISFATCISDAIFNHGWHIVYLLLMFWQHFKSIMKMWYLQIFDLGVPNSRKGLGHFEEVPKFCDRFPNSSLFLSMLLKTNQINTIPKKISRDINWESFGNWPKSNRVERHLETSK